MQSVIDCSPTVSYSLHCSATTYCATLPPTPTTLGLSCRSTITFYSAALMRLAIFPFLSLYHHFLCCPAPSAPLPLSFILLDTDIAPPTNPGGRVPDTFFSFLFSSSLYVLRCACECTSPAVFLATLLRTDRASSSCPGHSLSREHLFELLRPRTKERHPQEALNPLHF